jgi:hypothetical protein
MMDQNYGGTFEIFLDGRPVSEMQVLKFETDRSNQARHLDLIPSPHQRIGKT